MDQAMFQATFGAGDRKVGERYGSQWSPRQDACSKICRKGETIGLMESL
jgi:hypothetical protein